MRDHPGYLAQMVQQNDDKHEAGHLRLRQDIRRMDDRIDALERGAQETARHVTRLEATPADVTKLYFAPRVVVAIVVTALALAGGQWELNATLRNELIKAIEVSTKLQDERASALKTSVDAMQRRQELQQYEIQGLKEEILKLRK
jgi:hypothetical protein